MCTIGWYKQRKGKMKQREDERIRNEPQNLGCCASESTLDEEQPARKMGYDRFFDPLRSRVVT
jgi:hypothetical protein